MSTPLEERPPPRRKSCTACIKAKRRCDLYRRPICSRCQAKGLKCEGADRGQSPIRQPSVDPGSGDDYAAANYGMAGTSRQPSAASSDPSTYAYDVNLSPSLSGAQSYGDQSSRFYWQPDTNPFTTAWSSAGTLAPTLAYPGQPMMGMSETSGYTSGDTAGPGSRFYYAVAWMKSLPRAFSQQNKMPFLHPAVFRHTIPKSIVNVFITCTLFSNKTDANQSLVYGIMDKNAIDLLSTDFSTLNHYDSLAVTQSLLLYQIMRIFDPTRIQQGQAEAAMPVLQNWVASLKIIRDSSDEMRTAGGFTVGSDLATPQSWDTWVYHESVRRTVIAAEYLIALHTVSKYQDGSTGSDAEQAFLEYLGPTTTNPLSPWRTIHPWTLSRQLWEASSALSFQTIWRDQPRYTICNLYFSDFLKHGTGDDVDDFGRLLLSTHMGMHSTARWLER